jgi:predicted GIY-YIG superfamily endonuclease
MSFTTPSNPSTTTPAVAAAASASASAAASDPISNYRSEAAARYALWQQQQQQQQPPQQISAQQSDAQQIAAQHHQSPQMWIYVLLCVGNKYYVGESSDVESRFVQHVRGEGHGAAWTRKYEPIEIIKKFAKATVHDEDNTTLDMMAEHGIQNVRGGSFCMVHLPKHIRRTIKQRIATMKKLCFQCKQPGHMASQCPNKSTTQKISWVDCDSEEEKDEKTNVSPLFSFDAAGSGSAADAAPPKPQTAPERLIEPLAPLPNFRMPVVKCSRCGRNYHHHVQCFAQFHIDGHQLPTK